jgi:hypothetical protein
VTVRASTLEDGFSLPRVPAARRHCYLCRADHAYHLPGEPPPDDVATRECPGCGAAVRADRTYCGDGCYERVRRARKRVLR